MISKLIFPIALMLLMTTFQSCSKNNDLEIERLKESIVSISNKVNLSDIQIRKIINGSADNRRDYFTVNNLIYYTNRFSATEKFNIQSLNDEITKISENIINPSSEIDIFEKNVYPIRSTFGDSFFAVNKVQNSGANIEIDVNIINTMSVKISEIDFSTLYYDNDEIGHWIGYTTVKNITPSSSKQFYITITNQSVKSITKINLSAKIRSINHN
jgi:hypothetical protein